MTRDGSAYVPVLPADVRAGDTYKFEPVGGGAPIFAQVIEVDQVLGLVRIARNGGPGAWAYITPQVGTVTFGRVVERFPAQDLPALDRRRWGR